MLLKFLEVWFKSLFWKALLMVKILDFIKIIETNHQFFLEILLPKKLSLLFFQIWMKSSKLDLKLLEHLKLINNSNKEKSKEPRNNGKINNHWEKNPILSFWTLKIGILLPMEDKLGLLIFMKPTVLLASSSTSNGNSSQLLIKEKLKSPK